MRSNHFISLIALSLLVSCSQESTQETPTGSRLGSQDIKWQGVDGPVVMPAAELGNLAASEVLEALDQHFPELKDEASGYLQDSNEVVDLGDAVENAMACEELGTPVSATSKQFGFGWLTGRSCWKHYWNPAYWSARLVAKVGYDLRGTKFGFKNKNRCKEVLVGAGFVECFTTVMGILLESGVGVIASKYAAAACALGAAGGANCACDEEY